MDVILINCLILTIRSWSCTDFLNDQSPLNLNAVCIFRYPVKILSAGTDNTLLSQKLYFANGGVFTTVIQPNPDKSGEV